MARINPPEAPVLPGATGTLTAPPAPMLGGGVKPVTATPIAAVVKDTATAKLPKLVRASDPNKDSGEKTGSMWNLLNPMAWNKAMTEVEMAFIKGVPHLVAGLFTGSSATGTDLYGFPVKYKPIRTVQEQLTSLKRVATGETIREGYRDIKAGRPPVMPIVETAGNVALVTGVAGGIAGAVGKGLSAEAAAAARGATFVAGTKAGATVSAAEAAAAAGSRGSVASALTKAVPLLKQAERISGKVGAGPALYHIKAADTALFGVGKTGRYFADKYRAAGIKLLEADPSDLVGLNKITKADKLNRWAGKPLVAEGTLRYGKAKVEVLNQKVLDTWTKRYTRAADAAEAEVTRAMLKIVDNPRLVEEFGPLLPVEQQAIIASLNGRGRLLARLTVLLDLSPESINHLGRLNYNEKFTLSPEGAKLAVDFNNNSLPKAQMDRLSVAAEQLSEQIEKQSSQARAGFGRSKPLDASHDMPFPVVNKFMESLKAKGVDDLYQEMLALREQGFFNDLADPDVAAYMRSVVNRAPRDIALDPMLYPAKERYNLAFYNRLTQGLESSAQMTAGGSPIPPGTSSGRPGPSLPDTGLPKEAVYDQVKGLGSLSRTPREFLVNSVKILNNLKGRVRILGEQLVELEMKTGKLERDIIRKRLEYETLIGWYEDSQGNRLFLEPGETPGFGAIRRQGQLELLREHRDGMQAVYDDMVAKQKQNIVVDGKTVTIAEVADAIENADSLVSQAEGMANQIVEDAGQIGEAIDQLDDAKADAANALDDAGVDPQPLAEAAIEDAMNLPEDLSDTTPGDQRSTFEAQLEQARITEKALADEYYTARMDATDAQSALDDANAKNQEWNRTQEAPKSKGLSRPNVVSGSYEDASYHFLRDHHDAALYDLPPEHALLVAQKKPLIEEYVNTYRVVEKYQYGLETSRGRTINDPEQVIKKERNTPENKGVKAAVKRAEDLREQMVGIEQQIIDLEFSFRSTGAVSPQELQPPRSSAPVSAPRQASDAVIAAEQRYIDVQDALVSIEAEYRQAQGITHDAELQLKALDEGPTDPVKITAIDNVEAQVTDPIVSVADQAAWTDHGNDNWSIDTGTRKYTAQRVVEGLRKDGKPKARWTSRRIASDGLPIESTAMDFKNFKELRDYVAETTKVDAQVLLETPIYRPGRELGEAQGLLTPPELLLAQKRLSSAEGRAVSLTRNMEKGEGRLLKMRETEAAKRAELVEKTQASVGLEARLGREIHTQSDVTTVNGKPTGRMFVAPEQGPPSVIRSVQEGDVPVGGTGPGRTQLRPIAGYTRTVDELANDAISENIALVDRSLADANLRRAEMLTQDIPLDVAMSAPQDLGQEFSGSQYVMGGQEAVQSVGPKGTQFGGLTGRITVTSEKLRGPNEGIYDIVELGRRMAKEQRQLTLNEGFKFVMNSKFAVTPLYLLGEQKVNELRQKSYEMAVGNPFGADAVTGGVGAYAEGLLNRDAKVRQEFNNAFGGLINTEMAKLGWETLPDKGVISDRVYVDKINGETKYLPAYAVNRISAKWVPYDHATGRTFIDLYLKANNKVTRAFKNLTLPLSVSWQIGDFVSNMMIANIFGVNPAAMARGLRVALKENFGDFRGAYNYVAKNEMPVLGQKAELLAPYVQDIGMRMDESMRTRGLSQSDTVPLGSQTPVVKYPLNLARAVRNGSYRFNETINRLQRHAFMLEKLQQNLDGLGFTIDDIVDHGLSGTPSNIQQAFYDAADTANDVLGDFMDLNKSERQIMLAHMPFYSWIKHVHKLFFKVAREHPSAIMWHAYVGSFVYDPEADPYGLTTGMWGVPGGLSSGNLMTPFADVWGGPLYQGLNKNDWSKAGSSFNPLVRTAVAAFTGFNLGQGRNITRPAGTGQLSQSGYQQNTPLIGRPKELAGFAAQQFPLLTKIADVMPDGQLPGTTMQLGPVKRYDTGQARPGALGLGEQKKYGGRLLAIPRLFTIPGLPTVSPEELRKRTLDAQMQTVRASISKEKAKLKSGQ